MDAIGISTNVNYSFNEKMNPKSKHVKRSKKSQTKILKL